MPSVTSDLSRHTVLTYILNRFGVDLHDYLASPEHPLHPCAAVAENIARAVLVTEPQAASMAERVRNILMSPDRDRSTAAAYLSDMSFVQGKHNGYEESLRLAIKPLLPRKPDSA